MLPCEEAVRGFLMLLKLSFKVSFARDEMGTSKVVSAMLATHSTYYSSLHSTETIPHKNYVVSFIANYVGLSESAMC